MSLCLQKIFVSLWCTVLLLWLPCSSLEASTTLNGLTSTFPSVTVEGAQPPESNSTGDPTGSSSLAFSQLRGSPLSRNLLQRSTTSETEAGGDCGLPRSQRRQFYSRSSRLWNITDVLLEELENDLQAIVACANPGDIILLPTTRPIQPPRSITISKSVTLTSQAAAPLTRNGTIIEAEKKARLHCPSSGELVVIRSGSPLFTNLIFEDCNGTGHVVSIETKCGENSDQDMVHFRHVEFSNLVLSIDRRLLEAAPSRCARLVMENVVLRDNICGSQGCMSLMLNNTLRDVQITRNQEEEIIIAAISPSILVLPMDSETVATNVSASENQLRLFNVFNGTFTLRESAIERNRISGMNQGRGTLIGGTVLLSNYSTLNIQDSSFVNNSGGNGVAVHALASGLNISNCRFGENDAGAGDGGAIYSINASSFIISSCNFSKNNAVNGAGVFSYRSSVVRVLNTTFVRNNGTRGGAIYANHSILDVRNALFDGNQVTNHGSAIYLREGVLSSLDTNITDNFSARDGTLFVYYSSALLRKILVHGNRVEFDGGGLRANHSNISVSRSKFENNYAEFYGSALHSTHSNISVSYSTFERNVADWQGGVLRCYNSSMSVSHSRFENNEGSDGGVLASSESNISMRHSRVAQNFARYDGGVLHSSDSNISVSHSRFERNFARVDGGVLHSSDSKISVSHSRFKDNSAQFDGGAVLSTGSTIEISLALFHNNSAGSNGGGVSADRSDIAIRRANFTSNVADEGGACYFSGSNATMKHVLFSWNHAIDGSGGGVYISNGRFDGDLLTIQENIARNWGGGIYGKFLETMSLENVHFHDNNGTFGGGGYFSNVNTTMQGVNISGNRAINGSGGGVFVTNNSRLNGISISLHSNVALEDGGGIEIEENSSLLCTRCEFRSNVAKRGGGMYAWNNDSILVVAQIQDSVFVHNKADDYGGGLHFSRPRDITINCSASSTTCGRVVLVNTNFSENVAGASGAAILTADPSGVLVLCNHMEPHYGFLNPNRLALLSFIHPRRLCSSWRGNQVATDAPGDVVGTYGKYLSFSVESDEEVRINGDVESGFVLENVASGSPLPVINVTVLDAYGKGPLPTFPSSVEARMTSSVGFVQGNFTTTIISGRGSLSNIIGYSKPGNYTLEIVPNTNTLHVANITIHVRECRIGEAPTNNNELCQNCDVISYNFDPNGVGGCTPCPDGATCESHFIIPKDGYWHESPCQPNVKECLTEEACTYEERQEELEGFANSFLDCYFNESVLLNYSRVLCREGYEGPLCGSCNKSYGLTMGFKCSKCPHAFESVLTLVFFTVYFLAVASFTIRGALPMKPKTSNAPVPSTSASRSEPESEQGQQRDSEVNLEMVKMLVEGRVPSAYFRSKHTPNTSIAPSPSIQSKDVEFTRWITAEIFKVMINFLQVTAVVASIGVQWPEGVLTMFETTEYIGALTTSALSRPIDCIVSSTSDIARSISRTLFSLCVPGVVMSIFAAIWGFVAFREKRGMSFFWKRTTLSVIGITYITYLELTKLGVRVFYCVSVYDSNDDSSNSQTKYWAIDTSIRCYEKEHIGLIVISAFVLLLVSLLFPLISGIYLFRNNVQPGQTNTWTHETMGFLYRAFKEKYVFWESIVMFRKACLSITVVFSYPLGGESQGLMALGVLLFCLYLQMACSPYREEFHKLNYYESGSLLVSCFTFILSQFFTIEQCPDFAKRLVEVTIIAFNTTFFAFLLIVFIKSGMNHVRAVLKHEDFSVDDRTSWWTLLKLFIKFKLSQVKLLKK